jgi:hypothetical protein
MRVLSMVILSEAPLRAAKGAESKDDRLFSMRASRCSSAQ